MPHHCAFNIEAYLTLIGLELDRKTDQTAACLCSGPLYCTLTQSRSIYLRRIPTPLEILEKRHAKQFGNNIHKLERKPAYIVAPWWESPAVNILNSKEKATQSHNEYLISKPSAETVAYTDGSGINEKIGSSCVIQGKTNVIKKFLGANTCSTVYMGELQGIEDSLSYTLSQDQSSGIRIFTDSQAALHALENPNGCSAPQIMQKITRCIDELRAKGRSIQLHWIPAHTDIKGNEEADVAAKEATGWRRAKRKNGKWKEWDSGYTADRHMLERAGATIKLALEQKTLELWSEAWSREKTGRELHAICPKPTKKVLKLHKGLSKAASTLIVQMRTEKIGLKKFLHFRKVPGFDSPECSCRRGLQSAKHVLTECRKHTSERNRTWQEERRKVAFGRISWEEMLTQPKFAKKAAQFMKSLGLIDQFKSAILD